jgi:hypothetical protein
MKTTAMVLHFILGLVILGIGVYFATLAYNTKDDLRMLGFGFLAFLTIVGGAVTAEQAVGRADKG